MATSTFKAKTLVDLDGRQYALLRLLQGDIWQLEDLHTQRVIEMPRPDLLAAYAEHRLVFISKQNPVKTAPELGAKKEVIRWLDPAAYEISKVRRSYVEAILEQPMTRGDAFDEAIAAVWGRIKQPKKMPSFPTVARWRAIYLRYGKDSTRLVDRQRGSHRSKRPAALRVLVSISIDEIWMTLERRTIAATLQDAIARVGRENLLRPDGDQLPLPGRRFVQRLIDDISAYDRTAARYGKRKADAEFRAKYKKEPPAKPLDRVEVDHTLMNIIVVEEHTGLPVGRPWLTVCIDVFSRCVLGFYIGFEPPSYVTVARALKQTFMPKAKLREEHPELRHAWEAHGVPKVLVVDNGPEFHSGMLEQACHSVGVDVEFCATKSPWQKGTIERFLGTINRETAAAMPGTTFSNFLEKGEYDSKEQACITLPVLKKAVLMWIVNYYHEKVHSTTKVPPAKLWESSISPDDIPVPEDPKRLDVIMARSASYVLAHHGIEIEDLPYNSPELTSLRHRLGTKLRVEVRIDDSDLSAITVISPERNELFRVPCLFTDYATAGFTRWMHKVCRRWHARHTPDQAAIVGLAMAKREITQMIADEMAGLAGKRRASARGARFTDGQEPATPGGGKAASKAAAKKPAALPAPSPETPPSPPEPAVQPKQFATVIEEGPFKQFEENL